MKEDLDGLQPKVNELSEELEDLGVVRICLAPPKEKMETVTEPEPRKVITPQQEKTSVLGRLHKARQIVDEAERRRQADRKKGHSMEH